MYLKDFFEQYFLHNKKSENIENLEKKYKKLKQIKK